MDLLWGQGARSPSSTFGMIGLVGGLPLESSTAPPNWLPSLGGWTLWYFWVVDIWDPL